MGSGQESRKDRLSCDNAVYLYIDISHVTNGVVFYNDGIRVAC